MEQKKIRMRELTEDDMVGFMPDNNRFMIDYLKNVTKRAAEIFDNEVLMSGESSTCKKEKREEKPRSRMINSQKENGEFARRNNLNSSTVDIPETSGLKKRKINNNNNNTSKSRSNGVFVKKRSNIGPDPPPPLPQEFKNTIQEQLAKGRNISKEILVVQKGLYKSDTEPQQSRLSIPQNSMVGEFLKDEEKAHLLKRHDGKLECISVPIIDPLLKTGRVDLRRWPMKKSNGKESVSYMLTGGWIEMQKRNDFKVGNVVQLWSVRIEEELVFCLVRLPGN